MQGPEEYYPQGIQTLLKMTAMSASDMIPNQNMMLTRHHLSLKPLQIPQDQALLTLETTVCETYHLICMIQTSWHLNTEHLK